MRSRFFTVLVVRHAGESFRRLRVSYPFVSALALVGLALTAAGLSAPHLLLRAQTQSLALQRLEQENYRLRVEREAFDGLLAQVSGRLDSAETQAARWAEELGLAAVPGVEAPAGGSGGPGQALERFWFESEARALESRSTTLDRSFDELGPLFQERLAQLAATPSVMPVDGDLSHGYGWRKDPFTGEREFHEGIDIVAPMNTAVVAPADGVVVRSGRFAQLGRSVDIAHGHGFVTRFGHLNQTLVEEGAEVRRGDRIGLVGSTGRSTGPHLHYEVLRDGKHVDPWKYLGQADKR
jgi:murein DD-endopeptidase MepM/ murein hydrolase activator NlpD